MLSFHYSSLRYRITLIISVYRIAWIIILRLFLIKMDDILAVWRVPWLKYECHNIILSFKGIYFYLVELHVVHLFTQSYITVTHWYIWYITVIHNVLIIYIYIYMIYIYGSKANIWNVNCPRAIAFIFDTRTGVLVKVSKSWRQKMSRPEGDSNPNLRIHAECSNHLTFAAPCFWILALVVQIFFEVKWTFEMLTVRGQHHSFSRHGLLFLWKCQFF